MANLTPLAVSDKPASILIEGDPACNVSDFVHSIVGASLVRSSLPRCLFMVDAEVDGRSAVARMGAWLTNYYGGEKPDNKMKCVDYLKDVLTQKPGALANHILETEPACSPFWVIRSDADDPNSPSVGYWHQYASAIRERIRCTCLHTVKRTAMGVSRVEPERYDMHLRLREYVIPNRERINNAMLLENVASGERIVFRDRPQAGGPSIWAPTFEEVAHA